MLSLEAILARHEGAFRPLGEEQSRSGKSHPGDKGFRELFPRAHRSRRVLGLGLPGQGWCRREQSGSTGVDRQECQQNWCGRTNYLGRHSHAAIEVNFGVAPDHLPEVGAAAFMLECKRVSHRYRFQGRCRLPPAAEMPPHEAMG